MLNRWLHAFHLQTRLSSAFALDALEAEEVDAAVVDAGVLPSEPEPALGLCDCSLALSWVEDMFAGVCAVCRVPTDRATGEVRQGASSKLNRVGC